MAYSILAVNNDAVPVPTRIVMTAYIKLMSLTLAVMRPVINSMLRAIAIKLRFDNCM